MRRSALHLGRFLGAAPKFPAPTHNSKTFFLGGRLGHPGNFRKFATHSKEHEFGAQGRDEHLLPESGVTPQGENENNGDQVTSEETQPRRRLRDVPISEVLKAKHTLRWVEPVIPRHATISDAIQVSIDNGLSGMMVTDDDVSSGEIVTSNTLRRSKVVGMITSRDLLRILNSGLKNDEDPRILFQKEVGDFMTPIQKVIYAKPEETIGTCRSIMGKLGVKCLPILSHGRVEGLITSRDMSEYGIDAAERGGKKHYLESVSERVGLSSNTSMAEPPAYIRAHLALQQNPLYMNVGIAELPHPFKTTSSCEINRRDYGPKDLTMDVDLSEDAHFVSRVKLPDETGQSMVDLMYLGVADGVGSWREYGVDPREFSHQFMQECENILKEASCKSGRKLRKGDEIFQRCMAPSELMAQAYERVKADNIIGSSTACVAMFDGIRHQLHFSNLGDSGIIVLRHIDSSVAGTLKRDKSKPRLERQSDLRVAFVSQQQLRSFNHPYQLGWTGEELGEDEETSFKSASQSCSSSIHIRRGDILILATDGLFDNVELEEISKLALEWEETNGFIRNGDIAARDKRWQSGSSMTNQSAACTKDLAHALVQRARENSLDSNKDSPFALLAKENDVMWSGGMPDDCTVIVMHIVGECAIVSANQYDGR